MPRTSNSTRVALTPLQYIVVIIKRFAGQHWRVGAHTAPGNKSPGAPLHCVRMHVSTFSSRLFIRVIFSGVSSIVGMTRTPWVRADHLTSDGSREGVFWWNILER